ncbi:MAG: rRNA maturation RNase YbeY [Pseudomonadota bacterium]|nr:rRNA maturation RNase YbeY [Pseudomonadota bacterium]
MTNTSPTGLPDGLPDAQDEPEPDSPSKERRLPSATFGIDIQCDDTRWQPYLVLVEARLGALAETLGLPEHGEVSVKLTDDRQISELNKCFRDKSSATNVLSFPALDFKAPSEKNDFPQMPFSLGDIVLAFDTLAFEAYAAEKDFADHLVHLLVHGLLHLLGYDHQNDADAVRMEARESTLLAGVGVDDPYGAANAGTEKGKAGGDKG